MAKFVKGHPKVGGATKGSKHKVTTRAKNAALDMLERFDSLDIITDDILQLTPAERVNAYIRLLALITPKNVDFTLSGEAALTIEERLALLSQANECH